MAVRRTWRIALRFAVPTSNSVRTLGHRQLLQQHPAAHAPPSTGIFLEFFRSYAKSSRRGLDFDEEDDDFVDPITKPDPQAGPRLNRAITSRFIRLVSAEGHKVVTREEALEAARTQGLDLVEVNPKSDPVVCKIMDYKLERYREKMRDKERKKSTVDTRRLNDVRELQVSNKIDDRDLEIKADQASKLVQKGHRLKCVVKVLIKGSKADEEAKANKDYKTDPKAIRLINKIIDLLKEVAKVESGPQVERHRVWAILRPLPPPTATKQKTSKKSGDKEDADAKPQEESATKKKQPQKQEAKEETKPG